MKKRVMSMAAMSFVLIAFVIGLAPVVRADGDGVDQKIQALEQELTRLKGEQMELKKEATAAVAALPTFSYRPTNGLMIEAADKSWAIRFATETHMRIDIESGRTEAGREKDAVFGRRFRPYFWYCLDNCFYEIELGLDLDGWGTGNAKNSVNSSGSSILQRGSFYAHFEQVSPWLPMLQVGMDNNGIGLFQWRQGGSSYVTAQAEYDVLSRNNGFNTGRAGNGWKLDWLELPLQVIGIPGRARFQFAQASIGEGDDGLESFKSLRSYNVAGQIEPFTQLKNKWLNGLGFSFNAFFCNSAKANTAFTAAGGPPPDNGGCQRNRVQDDGDGGRQTLFDSGTRNSKGLSIFLSPELSWTVGPYQIYVTGGFQRYDFGHVDGAAAVGARGQRATDFLIGHQLYVWSPKGFLTGDANTAGSILLGYHFDRGDFECGHQRPLPPCGAGGQFSREAVFVNEWDFWYVLGPRHSVGVNLQWWNASNLRTGYNQAGDNLGIFSARCSASCVGKGGDWVTAFLNWRLSF